MLLMKVQLMLDLSFELVWRNFWKVIDLPAQSDDSQRDQFSSVDTTFRSKFTN